MSVVLDTHVWVWWCAKRERLSRRAIRVLEKEIPDGELFVPAIACWEAAKLVEKQRLVLSIPVSEWVEQALAEPAIRLAELTPTIAVHSTQLPASFHGDPADQLIVATARCLDLPLITADKRIRQYAHVRTIW